MERWPSHIRRTAGTGFLLAAALFFLPLLTVGEWSGGEELPTGELPIRRAVQAAGIYISEQARRSSGLRDLSVRTGG